MKYVNLAIVALPAIYLVSFILYSWKENKLAAAGSMIIALISIALPAYMLFMK